MWQKKMLITYTGRLAIIYLFCIFIEPEHLYIFRNAPWKNPVTLYKHNDISG